MQKTMTVLLLSTLAAAAQADVVSGPYIGVGAGASRFHFDAISTARTASDRNDFAQKIYGGYRFTENWGAEIGYANLGRIDNTYAAGKFKGRAEAFYLAGTGRLPLGERFALTGKAMLAWGRTKADAGASSAAEFGQLRGSGRSVVLGGLGAEYAFAPNMAVSVEYDSFGAISKKGDAAMLSANLKYHF